jgi:hypothetical protein
LEYSKITGKTHKKGLSDKKFYVGKLLELYAVEDELDQQICRLAKEQDIDIIILTNMVGSHQIVTEILDTRNREDSFKSLVYFIYFMVKILAIGDFHGKFPEKLKKIIKKEKINLIVSVGDYADANKIRISTLNALQLADKNLVTSISFPALGTGVGGFSVFHCAKIMITETIEFLMQSTHLRHLRFVLFDKLTFDAFEEELKLQFSSKRH